VGFLFPGASKVYFRKRMETKDEMRKAHLGFGLQVPRPGSTELIPFLIEAGIKICQYSMMEIFQMHLSAKNF